jgi:hypothetical protein
MCSKADVSDATENFRLVPVAAISDGGQASAVFLASLEKRTLIERSCVISPKISLVAMPSATGRTAPGTAMQRGAGLGETSSLMEAKMHALVKSQGANIGPVWRPSSITQYTNGRTVSREGNSRPLFGGALRIIAKNKSKCRQSRAISLLQFRHH